MLVYQIKKYIGSYAAAMNGLDAVLFTGGIGENATDVRERVCADMSFFGIEIDNELNSTFAENFRKFRLIIQRLKFGLFLQTKNFLSQGILLSSSQNNKVIK